MTATERWLPINGFDKYEVSTFGRVRSRRKVGPPHVLKPYPASKKNPYPMVHLGQDGHHKRQTVHRLLMEAFCGPSDLQVNHINAVKTDCRLENLEYVTAKENTTFGLRVIAYRMGGSLPPPTARSPMTELKFWEEVR